MSKDLTFEFFSYKLGKSKNPMENPEVQVEVKHAQKHFGSLFFRNEHLKMGIENSRKQYDSVENTVMQVKEDIIYWRIHRHQMKKIVSITVPKEIDGVDEVEKKDHDSYPESFIIIDNREDHMVMAIQKNAIWGNNSNNAKYVAVMLEKNLNAILGSKFGLEIIINPLTLKAETWDFCKKLCKDGNDYIKSIEFKITNPDKTQFGVSRNDEAYAKVLEQLQNAARFMVGKNSVVHADYEKNELIPEEMERKKLDIVNAIMLCTQVEYETVITLNKYGSVTPKEVIPTIFLLSEDCVNRFFIEARNLEGRFELADWLDECLLTYESRKNETEAPPAKKR